MRVECDADQLHSRCEPEPASPATLRIWAYAQYQGACPRKVWGVRDAWLGRCGRRSDDLRNPDKLWLRGLYRNASPLDGHRVACL
jgi:hypothetical protein